MLGQVDPSGINKGYVGRFGQMLDKGTKETFDRRRVGQAEKQARLGGRRSSADVGERASMNAAEGREMGMNPITAEQSGQRIASSKLQDILSSINSMSGLSGRGMQIGQTQLGMDQTRRGQNASAMGPFGGMLGNYFLHNYLYPSGGAGTARA